MILAVRASQQDATLAVAVKACHHSYLVFNEVNYPIEDILKLDKAPKQYLEKFSFMRFHPIFHVVLLFFILFCFVIIAISNELDMLLLEFSKFDSIIFPLN